MDKARINKPTIHISYQKMVEMPLHSSFYLNGALEITRVPGGWVYHWLYNPDEGSNTAVFVPIKMEE